MGRHRKHPLSNGSVAKAPSSGSTVRVREDVEHRIGLHNSICMNCNGNNPPNADRCRNCGSDELRSKKGEYSDS